MPGSGDENSGGLRVISDVEKPRRSEVGPEIQGVLDDMKRCRRVMYERLEGDGDTPEAA